MARAESRAEAAWEGNLTEGSGTVSGGSGATGDLEVTWKARTERPDPKTSPEELLAEAHAACFAMAFSNTLNEAGHAPERLSVSAVCTFEVGGGGAKITTMDLNVVGRVPGLDPAEFERLAQEADRGCPVSNALRGNLDIRVNARLDQ